MTSMLLTLSMSSVLSETVFVLTVVSAFKANYVSSGPRTMLSDFFQEVVLFRFALAGLYLGSISIAAR